MKCAVAGCEEAVHPVRVECGIYTCITHGNHAKTQGVMLPTNGKCGMTLQLIPGEARHLQGLMKKQAQRNRWAG